MMELGIENVNRFMIEHDVFVPMTIIVGVATFLCISGFYLFLTRTSSLDFIRNLSWILLLGYVFLSLCATIIFRNETPEMRFSLYPLRSYTMGSDTMMLENIMNIFFFFPIGFLLGIVMKKKNVWLVTFVGFILSVLIETIQLFSIRGVCNIDDVINNTLGCALGYCMFLLFDIIWKKYL